MKESTDVNGTPASGAANILARRVVLVGASNLTKSIDTVLSHAHGAWGQPLEVLTALGHGRSFGRASSVLGRVLPGILECGLWDALERRPNVPTAALVTDIGNDVLYGEAVDTIEHWVATCLDRLDAVGARTVVTLLPVDNLARLSRARFLIMRTLLVPRSRLSFETVASRVHALNERVERLAIERGFALAVQRADWYGFDPVHIRLRSRARAWKEILSGWLDSPPTTNHHRPSLARTLYLRSRVPHRRRLWGIEQRRRQPAARLRDGTTVALY
jgi:hypothetical protein